MSQTESQRGRAARLLDVLIPAVGVLVLVAGLLTWWRATQHDADEVVRAELRDTVLITATSQIETMNTLDYRDVDAGLEKWQDVTTGTLHDQIVEQGTEQAPLLEDQKKISQGHVVQAAVLDLTEDTATVIAAVEVTVQDGTDLEAEPTVKRHRYSADLVEVDGEWLLEALEQVAVSIS
ncbi:hypothetical protein FXB39_03280 [Nocardioides sp. BGMRC 2183]|nr:hypothetical protein FXB39_03280 [Nocardioides sp. BGMRC 2183]